MGEEEKITGSTPLGDASGLIPIHITTVEALNKAEFDNVSRISTKYLLKRPSKQTRYFTYGWFLRLHKDMFGDVWQWAGKLRKTEMNIGVRPERIGSELHRLRYVFLLWKDEKLLPIEIAAKLHHRLVWIHPFEGGNGRLARLASNVFLRSRDLPLVQWPEEEIVVQGGFRDRYIQALKAADSNDFHKILELHRKYQQRA